MGRPWTEREMLGRLKDFAESPFAEKLLDPEARKRILAQTDPDKAFFF
jgi:hypothetical protein